MIEYLSRRSQDEKIRITEFRDANPGDPRAVLRAIVAAMRADYEAPGFRGCPFINAAAEFADPASPVRATIAEHRAWYRETMRQLAREIGSSDPESAADDLVLLRDGAMVSGYLGDPDNTAAALTRAGRTVVARL